MVKLLIISIIILTCIHIATLVHAIIQRVSPRVFIRNENSDINAEDRIYLYQAKHFLRHLEFTQTKQKLEKEIIYYSFLLIIYALVLNSLLQPPLLDSEYVKPYVLPLIIIGFFYKLIRFIFAKIKNKKIQQKADRKLRDIERIIDHSIQRGNI